MPTQPFRRSRAFVTAFVLLAGLPAGTPAGAQTYKRIHQNALRALLEEKPAEAARIARDFLEDHPADGESHFVLALVAATEGEERAAARHVRRAVEAGVPPGRFLAGPRALVEPLAETDALRRLRRQVETEHGGVVHGPLLGAVTDRSAHIWVRTASEGTVRVAARTADTDDPDGTDDTASQTVRGEAESTAAADFTAVVELEGLRPDTTYTYHVWTGDAATPAGPQHRLRTFSEAGRPARFTFVFGGGAGYVPEHERVWSTIRSHEPDALLLLGDNVYIDDPTSRPMQRYCYYRRQSRPEFRALTASTPTYAIWDDHDFGTNDCWGGPAIEEPPWKREVWQVFRQNWANPAYGGGAKRPGCWYDFRIADVHFILLDCRYYREDPGGEQPGLLGPAQLDWLRETLAGSEGTFKVLASSVPWDFRTKGDSPDTWNGYRAERAEIFRSIRDRGIEGVVLISADRHRSDAWLIDADAGKPEGLYDLYEFNSSRLTNEHRHGEKDAAIFSFNDTQSFGQVEVDTTAGDPTITYRVVTIEGETVHELTVRRSSLELP